MKNKTITILLGIIFALGSFASIGYASEVSGNLSSSGISSTTTDSGGGSGSGSSGTINGTVIGGTTGSGGGGNGGGGSGGGGTSGNGGGGSTVTGTTTTGSGTQTTDNFGIGGTNDDLVASAGEDAQFQNTTTGTPDQSLQISANQNGDGQANENIPLGASAGDAMSIGTRTAWILFILLLLAIAYTVYRVVRNRNVKKTTTK